MRVFLRTEDVVFYDDFFYFFSNDFNSLFRFDKEIGIAEKLTEIPNEEYNLERLYSTIFEYEGKIILVPCFANELAVFDINSAECIKFVMPKEFEGKTKVTAAYMKNGIIYLFPISAKSIYSFCVQTGEFKEVYNFGALIDDEMVFDKSDGFFRKQLVCVNDNIYLPFCNVNAILKFNLQSNEAEVIQIDTNSNGYAGIAVSGEELYCAPRKRGMRGLKYNIATKKYEYLDSTEFDTVGMSVKDNHYCYFDMSKYDFVKVEDGSCYYYDIDNQELVKHNKHSEEKYKFFAELNDNDIRRLKKDMREENAYYYLESFLKMI